MKMISALQTDFVVDIKKEIERIQEFSLQIEADIQFQENKRIENLQRILDAKAFLIEMKKKLANLRFQSEEEGLDDKKQLSEAINQKQEKRMKIIKEEEKEIMIVND